MHAAQIAVTQWLNDVVIGLNLCPFSGKPTRENRVRFYVSEAEDEEMLLSELQQEMELLDKHPATEIETTLVIVPDLLQDFFDYTQFLHWVNRLLKRMGWLGVYQIASFHPDYQFADTEPDAAENYTNRSPFPMLHLLREASLEAAIDNHPDVDGIPPRNIELMNKLGAGRMREILTACHQNSQRAAE